MFGSILKGTKIKKRSKGKKGLGWRVFGSKDTNRWKKEGDPKAMMRMTKKVK